jgi:hypothetical protein
MGCASNGADGSTRLSGITPLVAGVVVGAMLNGSRPVMQVAAIYASILSSAAFGTRIFRPIRMVGISLRLAAS